MSRRYRCNKSNTLHCEHLRVDEVVATLSFHAETALVTEDWGMEIDGALKAPQMVMAHPTSGGALLTVKPSTLTLTDTEVWMPADNGPTFVDSILIRRANSPQMTWLQSGPPTLFAAEANQPNTPVAGSYPLKAGTTQVTIYIGGAGGGGGAGYYYAGSDTYSNGGAGGNGTPDRYEISIPRVLDADIPITFNLAPGGQGGRDVPEDGQAAGNSRITVGTDVYVLQGGFGGLGAIGDSGGSGNTTQFNPNAKAGPQQGAGGGGGSTDGDGGGGGVDGQGDGQNGAGTHGGNGGSAGAGGGRGGSYDFTTRIRPYSGGGGGGAGSGYGAGHGGKGEGITYSGNGGDDGYAGGGGGGGGGGTDGDKSNPGGKGGGAYIKIVGYPPT